MTILILGGTGKVGRRVAHRLPDARAVSRTFDLDDPATWTFTDVTAAYVLEPELGEPRVPRLAAAAVAAGVERLVLLSAPGADAETHPLHTTEQAVQNSGAEWTILRPTWFSQNFSEAFWLPGVLSGALALPTGDGRVPFIDAEDIADVAAAALTEPGHHGRTYELTGPRALTFAEAAALIGEATGRTIIHTDITPEAHTAQQIAHGVPPEVARYLTGLLVAIRDGEQAALTEGVHQALGRPPRAFEDFVKETAATGAWS